MKKAGHALLMALAALAAFYAVKYFRQELRDGQDYAALGEQIKQMDAEAARQHPDMAKTDAVKAVANDMSSKKLQSLNTSEQRSNAAADMFFGYLFFNTRARVAYCKERGVDISPFVSSLTTANSAELARANEIYAKAGLDVEEQYKKIEGHFAPLVEQDMKDVTAGAGVPLESACALFVENADLIAQNLPLNPDVRKSLMAAN